MKRRNPYPVGSRMQSPQHPFGMLMKERMFSSGNYRYGFNSQEKDDEVAGEGNSIAYDFRIFDARLARFSCGDPREREYPWQSTFAYYSNCPIWKIDMLGGGGPEGTKEKTVKSGETLGGIAKASKTTVVNLMKLNPSISDANKIYAGQMIYVPGAPSTNPATNPSETPKPAAKIQIIPFNNTSPGYTPSSSDNTVVAFKPVVTKPPPKLPVNGFDSKQAWNDFCFRCYQVNEFNPIANGVNAISTYATGHDTWGVSQTNAQATTQLAMAFPINKVIGASEVILNKAAIAILKDGYYEVNGFKFSETYYNKLWNTGRGAPSLIAGEILGGTGGNPIGSSLTKKGFSYYVYGGWEMVYNPITKEVWHLQPIK